MAANEAPDVRLSTGLPSHRKTRRLIRRCGPGGAWSLVVLILYARVNHSDGVFLGVTDEDIELAADWTGEPGAFVRALVDVRFLDGPELRRELHDWQEHNRWSAGAVARSDKARRAALRRHYGTERGEEMFHAELARRNARGMQTDAPSMIEQCSNDATSTDEQCPVSVSVSVPVSVSVSKKLSAASPADSPPDDGDDELDTDRSLFANREFALAAEQTPETPVVSIPTNRAGIEFDVMPKLVRELAGLYPAVDVPAQLRAMRAWALTNPTNRKTPSGVLRFVNGWLSREQNRDRTARPGNGASRYTAELSDDETLIARAIAREARQ
jgi:hypothetical protein